MNLKTINDKKSKKSKKNSKNNKVLSALRKTSFILISGVVFFVPLIVLPWTSEFYETNKATLVIFVSSLLLFLLGLRLSITGKFSVLNSKFDLWIGLVLLSSFLSLIFGKHFITGVLGYSGRLSEGFIVLLCLLFITLIIRQIIIDKSKLDTIFLITLISGSIVGLITILQYFGVYPLQYISGFDFTQSRSFSTIGSTQALPFFFLILSPLAFAFFLSKIREAKKALAVLPTVILIFGGFIFSAGNFWSWPGIILWGIFLLSILVIFSQSKKLLSTSVVWLVIILVFSVVFFIGRNFFPVNKYVTETPYTPQPTLGYDVAWNISAGSISESPVRGLFGSGPDSFAYNFNKFRPESYNETDNWNIRFSRSSNQIFEIITNFGFVGLVIWIGLFAAVVIYVMNLLKESHSYPFNLYILGLGLSAGVIIISSLFTYFTLSIWLIFWVILGLLVSVRAISIPRLSEKVNFSLLMSREKIAVEKQHVFPYVILIPFILIALSTLFGLQKYYRAEIWFRKAQVARVNASKILENAENAENESSDDAEEESPDADNDNNQAETNQQVLSELTNAYNSVTKSVNIFPYRSSYHRNKAVYANDILRQLSGMASDQVEEYEQERRDMVSVSTESIREAIDLNPIDVRNWEARFLIYNTLIELTNGSYGSAAVNALENAIELDPVKSQLYHQYGVLLSRGGLDQQALDELKKAVELQPMLLDARYDLASQYQKLNMSQEARVQLESLLAVMDKAGLQGTEAYIQVEEALGNVADNADDAAGNADNASGNEDNANEGDADADSRDNANNGESSNENMDGSGFEDLDISDEQLNSDDIQLDN
jgi:hypothetical protein